LENASKALIIAGAILLAILIIGLGVYIYRQAAGVIDTGTMDQLVVSQFNAQFEPYLGNNVSGSNVKQLIKIINASNRAKEDLPVTIEVDGEEVKNDSKIKSGNTYKVESSSEGNKAGYIEKITIKTNGDDSGSGGTSGRETGGKV
jgi:divalent metal cation (Fe/Co/Zn/Cd) transporter